MRALCLLLVAASGCSDEFEQRAEELSSSECDDSIECNGLVAVACGTGTDGPTYYFDADTVDVVSYCGGFCYVAPTAEEREYCRTMCPPPAWTCTP